MTVLKLTRTVYEVRVYVKGCLCAFYVEGIDHAAATKAGEDMVKALKTMKSQEFLRYTVPGEYRKERRVKEFDEV